jgi:hypothetical protein
MTCAVARLSPAFHQRDELVADVDESGVAGAAAELDVEQLAVELERAIDVVDLESDVVDPDEARLHGVVHGTISIIRA